MYFRLIVNEGHEEVFFTTSTLPVEVISLETEDI